MTQVDADRLILRATATGPEQLACPVCGHAIDVPAIQSPSDALADVFGMSSRVLAQQMAEQEAWQAADQMRGHLTQHTPEQWLTIITSLRTALAETYTSLLGG